MTTERSIDDRVKRVTSRLDQRDFLGSLRKICREYHVTVEEVLGDHRTPHIVRARDAFVFYLVDSWQMTPPAIGRLLDRDHTGIREAYLRFKAKK